MTTTLPPPDIVAVDGGAEARRGSDVVGRLVAEVREDGLRGRHAWSGLGDHHVGDPERYRDLYAVAGASWLDAGARSHYVVIPATAEVLHAWLGVAFAIQQVHAARSLADLADWPEVVPQPGVVIRQGSLDDLDAALRLAPLITEHQRAAPVWSGLERSSDAELQASWQEALSDPAATWFLAERDGRPLGGLLLWAAPDEPVALEVAATLPEARGLGVGVALTDHALRWAHAHGHERMTTDWRIANLLASRFWPRRGFVPTAYRMVRYLHADDR